MAQVNSILDWGESPSHLRREHFRVPTEGTTRRANEKWHATCWDQTSRKMLRWRWAAADEFHWILKDKKKKKKRQRRRLGGKSFQTIKFLPPFPPVCSHRSRNAKLNYASARLRRWCCGNTIPRWWWGPKAKEEEEARRRVCTGTDEIFNKQTQQFERLSAARICRYIYV